MIALALLAILAEEGMIFAGDAVTASTYSNGDCCPAARPTCCNKKKTRSTST